MCLLWYRLTALQESGFYEIFADLEQSVQRSNSECQLNDSSIITLIFVILILLTISSPIAKNMCDALC